MELGPHDWLMSRFGSWSEICLFPINHGEFRWNFTKPGVGSIQASISLASREARSEIIMISVRWSPSMRASSISSLGLIPVSRSETGNGSRAVLSSRRWKHHHLKEVDLGELVKLGAFTFTVFPLRLPRLEDRDTNQTVAHQVVFNQHLRQSFQGGAPAGMVSLSWYKNRR